MDHRLHSSRYRNRACENCRQRKKRCDTEKPQCRRCLQSGAKCVYPLLSLKPGPKKRFRNDDSTCNSASDRRGLLQHPVPGPQDMARGSQNNTIQTESDDRHSASLPAQCHDSSFSLPPPDHPPENDIHDPASVRLDLPDSGASSAGDAQSSGSLVEPKLPPHGIIIHLVEVFFESVQPQFHLLHRPCFLQRLHSGSLIAEEHSSLLLYAMFALAARYTDDPRVHAFDLALLDDTRQPRASYGPHWGKLERWECGKGFIRRASRIFYDELMEAERLELENGTTVQMSLLMIQGATLLSYAKLAMGTLSQAHSMVSACVRMAYDAGLDRIDHPEHRKFLHVYSSCQHQESQWVKREGLRHVWWCIWELDSFLGSAKCQPWMINIARCQTKLPVDDDDWFEGNEVDSAFLSSSLDTWREVEDPWQCTSFLGNRIVSLNFLMTLIDAANNENPGDSCSTLEIEQCVAMWRKKLPAKLKFEPRSQRVSQSPYLFAEIFSTYITIEQIDILIARAQMFTNVDALSISDQCQSYRIKLLNPGVESIRLPASQKLLEAFLASDVICDIVKSWPRYSISRSCPFIILGFWTPACLQLLVKAFATSTWDLREKALQSFHTLVFVMEQIAEYWGLGRIILSSFRNYAEKLNHSQPRIGVSDIGKELPITKRLLSLPNYIADAISSTMEEGSALGHGPPLGIGEQVINGVEIHPAELWDAEPYGILMNDPDSGPLFCPTPSIDEWMNAALEGVFEANNGHFSA